MDCPTPVAAAFAYCSDSLFAQFVLPSRLEVASYEYHPWMEVQYGSHEDGNSYHCLTLMFRRSTLFLGPERGGCCSQRGPEDPNRSDRSNYADRTISSDPTYESASHGRIQRAASGLSRISTTRNVAVYRTLCEHQRPGASTNAGKAESRDVRKDATTTIMGA